MNTDLETNRSGNNLLSRSAEQNLLGAVSRNRRRLSHEEWTKRAPSSSNSKARKILLVARLIRTNKTRLLALD